MKPRFPLRRVSIPDQRRRSHELDELRLQRGLTSTEQAEADRLAEAHYHRVWRAEQTVLERRIAGAIPCN